MPLRGLRFSFLCRLNHNFISKKGTCLRTQSVSRDARVPVTNLLVLAVSCNTKQHVVFKENFHNFCSIIDSRLLYLLFACCDMQPLDDPVGHLFSSSVAFLFNWIGFFLSFCLTTSAAGRYGAISGFGLSLIKWILIVRVSIKVKSSLSRLHKQVRSLGLPHNLNTLKPL